MLQTRRYLQIRSQIDGPILLESVVAGFNPTGIDQDSGSSPGKWSMTEPTQYKQANLLLQFYCTLFITRLANSCNGD